MVSTNSSCYLSQDLHLTSYNLLIPSDSVESCRYYTVFDDLVGETKPNMIINATEIEIRKITNISQKKEPTSCMIFSSGVKILGNNHGTDVATIPRVKPRIAPMMTSDLSSIRACFISLNFQDYNNQ